MAIYQLKTFADIVAAVREELKIPSTDTTTINRIKRDINMVYLQEVVPFEKWDWLRGYNDVVVQPRLSGTASATQGSRTITLGASLGKSVAGYWFSFDSQSERYRVYSHSASSTTLVLETPFSGSDLSSQNYKIWNDTVNLPPDVRETIEVTTDLSTSPLEGCGLQKFRKYSNPLPKAEGTPQFYSLGDYIDPDPYSTISGLPAALTRSSDGVIKTLTFASSVANYLSEGDRIKVISAGEDSYNGEWVVSSVSSASITYTAVVNVTESSTSDTSYVVTLANNELDEARYRQMLVYPSITTSRITLHVDYIRDVTPLENDSDEPLIPIQDRLVLVYGALARAWPRERNPEEGSRNQQLFDRKLAKMAGKLDDSTDTPILRPSRVYLATKRSPRHGLNNAYGPTGFGTGGSGATTISGTANTVATFNSNGELAASTVVSVSELGWLDNAATAVTTTLANNQSSATTIASYEATYLGCEIEYVISRGTGNVRVGAFYIATDGTSVASNDDQRVLLGTTGVTLSAAVSGSNINFQYTSTNTGTAPTIEYWMRKL